MRNAGFYINSAEVTFQFNRSKTIELKKYNEIAQTHLF
jgi:hypothetical protein